MSDFSEIDIRSDLAHQVRHLQEENAKLRKVIEENELCHDSQLTVGKKEFFKGCLNYIQQKFSGMTLEEILDILYPTAEENAKRAAAMKRIEDEIDRLMH